MAGRHILMLLSNGYTRDPRVRHETRALTGAGHRVTVLAWDRDGEGPARETLDGATIIRLQSTRGMRFMKLDLLRLRGWWRLAAREGAKVHASDPVDAIHSHDLDTLPAALRLKKRFGLPVVYDAHEIWGYMLGRDVPEPVPAMFLRLEARLSPRTDHIITVNQALADRLRRLAPDVPVTIVQSARPVNEGPWVAPPEGELVVLYVGRLNAARFIVPAIEALSGLEGVRLVVAGIGKPDYVARVERAAQGAANVEFLGPVANDTVLDRTRAAHAVLHMLDPNDRNNRIASGNKQFEAMAAGRAIICTEATNDGAIAAREGHGLVIPFDKAALRAAVERLRDDRGLVETLGRRALDAAKREYNWAVQERRLLAVYDDL